MGSRFIARGKPDRETSHALRAMGFSLSGKSNDESIYYRLIIPDNLMIEALRKQYPMMAFEVQKLVEGIPPPIGNDAPRSASGEEG